MLHVIYYLCIVSMKYSLHIHGLFLYFRIRLTSGVLLFAKGHHEVNSAQSLAVFPYKVKVWRCCALESELFSLWNSEACARPLLWLSSTLQAGVQGIRAWMSPFGSGVSSESQTFSVEKSGKSWCAFVSMMLIILIKWVWRFLSYKE